MNLEIIKDYDCGSINDYGGGNIKWWQDYIRAEINRCNEYWREQIKDIRPESAWEKHFPRLNTLINHLPIRRENISLIDEIKEIMQKIEKKLKG